MRFQDVQPRQSGAVFPRAHLALAVAGDLLAVVDESLLELSLGSGLAPGEARPGEVTVANRASAPTSLSLREERALGDPADEAIALGVEATSAHPRRWLYLGEIGGLPGSGIDLGRFLAGESRRYRFTVMRSAAAPARSISVRARYRWCPHPRCEDGAPGAP